MKRSMLKLLFFGLAVLLINSGCSNAAGNNKEDVQTSGEISEVKTVAHELGEAQITGIPKRIVALEYSFIDSLVTLGITPIGIADDNNPESIIGPIKEKLGNYTSVGSRYEVNFELISSLKSDLIIGDISRHKEVFARLEDIAPTLLLKSHGATYSENLSSFPVIAEALGKQEAAQQLLQKHQETLDELKKSVPENEQRTILPAVVNAKGFYAHTTQAYAGSLIEHIGLKDAIQSDVAYPQLTLEQLIEYNPDVLILMKSGTEETIVSEWSKNPLWEEVNAVKNNQVYEVDRGVWSLSRGIISAETIAKELIALLYP